MCGSRRPPEHVLQYRRDEAVRARAHEARSRAVSRGCSGGQSRRISVPKRRVKKGVGSGPESPARRRCGLESGLRSAPAFDAPGLCLTRPPTRKADFSGPIFGKTWRLKRIIANGVLDATGPRKGLRPSSPKICVKRSSFSPMCGPRVQAKGVRYDPLPKSFPQNPAFGS